jgi:hypothetical protein
MQSLWLLKESEGDMSMYQRYLNVMVRCRSELFITLSIFEQTVGLLLGRSVLL